jgi:hypothetical protein
MYAYKHTKKAIQGKNFNFAESLEETHETSIEKHLLKEMFLNLFSFFFKLFWTGTLMS